MELIATILFVWLFAKCFKVILALAWGTTKIIASILMILSLPLLIIGVVLVGGVFLCLPIGLVIIAIGIIQMATN